MMKPEEMVTIRCDAQRAWDIVFRDETGVVAAFTCGTRQAAAQESRAHLVAFLRRYRRAIKAQVATDLTGANG
jgi:hypothetical protein